MQALLDDQLVKVASMQASPFIGPLESVASDWKNTLDRLQDILDNWLTCQSTWQYLEPVFSSPDIMKQMPEEGDKFVQVETLCCFCSSPVHLCMPPCRCFQSEQQGSPSLDVLLVLNKAQCPPKM